MHGRPRHEKATIIPKPHLSTIDKLLAFTLYLQLPRSSQSIKIGTDLSLDKSIKIGKSDLIDIKCIDQSVEIDDTLVSFIELSRFYVPIPSIYIGRYICSSVHPKMKNAFIQTVNLFRNLLTIELQLRVKGSNNIITFLKKKLKNVFFSLKPALKSSSDGRYWPCF